MLTGCKLSEELLHVQNPHLGKAIFGENVALCTPKHMLNGRADYVLHADNRPQKLKYCCNCRFKLALSCILSISSAATRFQGYSRCFFDDATRDFRLLAAPRFALHLRANEEAGVYRSAPSISAGFW